jgi:predicted PurR-regulated permease PerM
MLKLLTSGMIVAALYFGRDIIVPIALAILLSFLLSPAVRSAAVVTDLRNELTRSDLIPIRRQSARLCQ